MTDNEIALICKRCREYKKDASGMLATADTNAAIKDIRAKAQALRLALKEMPYIVHANLPANVRKMLEPERAGKPTDALEQALLNHMASQEPELLRILRSIEDSLQGGVALVNKSSGKQPDYYAKCVLNELARLHPASEYKTIRAMIFALADKFNLDADKLYYRHTHPNKK